MPHAKSASSKARVRAGAKGRLDDKNEQAIGELLDAAEAEKNEWLKKPVEWRKANPFIPDPSLAIGRITASQGAGGFSILFPQKEEPVQVRVLGNAALADKIAQVFKTVKLAGADQWPMAICYMPAASSHVKTGELLALLEGSHAAHFGKLGFKVPSSGDGLDDVFEFSAAGGGECSAAGGGEDEVNVDDL